MVKNSARFLVHTKNNAFYLDVLIRTLIHNWCLYRVFNISLCLCKRRSLRCHATDYSDAFVIRDIIFHQLHEFFQFYETKSSKRKIIRLKLYVYLPTEARTYKAEYRCVMDIRIVMCAVGWVNIKMVNFYFNNWNAECVVKST